ncbi:ribonuclease III [Piedraia hortae CBS 480.64]|uniref:Ribonuclease III n=1 Tax=Piedraia hortae CBS 480.64 TaxID=1314780 RepID=A0A6A7C3X7_9PEZI|nr:ribonuclease III [Piedraia hortae CBS 480.64]
MAQKRKRDSDNPHDGSDANRGAKSMGRVPPYRPLNTQGGFPPVKYFPPELPTIQDPDLAVLPFRHKSLTQDYNRSIPTGQTYDDLEFLGDAQIELMASRLLVARYPNVLAGHKSQLRELLVKNETLAEFAKMYNFDSRIPALNQGKAFAGVSKGGKGNKGFLKVMADMFEAYVAAVVLDGGDEGFEIAERWLTELWGRKLCRVMGDYPGLTPVGRDNCSAAVEHTFSAAVGEDSCPAAVEHTNPTALSDHPCSNDSPLRTFDHKAKQTLQRRILSGPGVRLVYKPYKPAEELKGDRIGQNRHFIGVYLTGFGYTDFELGRGEGRNKTEAGCWAAIRAMWGEHKHVVDACAAKVEGYRERLRREREGDGTG